MAQPSFADALVIQGQKDQEASEKAIRQAKRANAWMVVYRIMVAIAVLLIGSAITISTVYIGREYHNDSQNKAIAARDEEIARNYSKAQKNALLQAARDYNKRLFENPRAIGAIVDPFTNKPGSFNGNDDKEYHHILNAPGDTMAVLTIPKISVKLPIHHGADQDQLENGLGHLPGTSFPVGGKNTRAVITGHSGLPGKTLFTNLPDLRKGDLFFVTVAGETLAYKVKWIEVVLPTNTKVLRIKPGKDLVTLLTCTPYGINTHRLLVTGERTKWPLYTAAPALSPSVDEIIMYTAATILALWILLLIFHRRYVLGHHIHRYYGKPWNLRKPVRSWKHEESVVNPIPAGMLPHDYPCIVSDESFS